ncbi:membrane frizzled-related protein-like [Centruroides sculpturatus]|uniref:membrane frizzled-related protein-like n=1 Tax=Centruroides sculpturatus TaxID=218467 RepID=UPI000C6E5303|nr:membrane frizzled-related protein-like [Centruroides sculpturatus]XP_023215453.1 membrane frizzled-related protein-like [Centruroides sculpturatus]
MTFIQIVFYSFLVSIQWKVFASCLYQFDSRFGKVGNFSSPHYPEQYPKDVECFYHFIGTDFETLNLTFHTFDLEPPYSKGCLTDYVDISSITFFNVKELIGRYCGSEIPTPMITMHPRAEIIFRTNHIIHHRGFHGIYEFKDETLIPPPLSTSGVKGCGGTESGVGGIISSPGYPHSFPKDVECVWLIRVNTNQHIYIRILELQLYGSIANCEDAELSIYDGYSSFVYNPNILKKFCGDLKYYKNVEEKTQLSIRNRLLIRFKTSVTSDVLGTPDKKIGFKLVWTAVTFNFGEPCTQFVCKESQYCLNSVTQTCKVTPQYCIDQSLVCDGLPNCSEDDLSDEDKCRIPLLIGSGVAVGIVILIIVISSMVYKRHRRVKKSISQTQGLTMQLRQLEHSPSFASRQVGNFYPATDIRSPIDINCSIHAHYDTVINNRYNYRTDV